MAKMTEASVTREATSTMQPTPAALDALGAINPSKDAVAYLLAKGWRCIGDPTWEDSRWLDPMQPLVAYYTEEPCMYEIEVKEDYTDERDGQVRSRWKVEKRQILAQDGRGGVQQAAKRVVYHPRGIPLTQRGAVEAQIERDMGDLMAREDARRKEESKKR